MCSASPTPFCPESQTELFQDCTTIRHFQIAKLAGEHMKQPWQISVAHIVSFATTQHVSEKGWAVAHPLVCKSAR